MSPFFSLCRSLSIEGATAFDAIEGPSAFDAPTVIEGPTAFDAIENAMAFHAIEGPTAFDDDWPEHSHLQIRIVRGNAPTGSTGQKERRVDGARNGARHVSHGPQPRFIPLGEGMPRYSRSLSELFMSIYTGYEEGDPYALYHAIRERPHDEARLTEFFEGYGVLFVEPSDVPESRYLIGMPTHRAKKICVAGMAGMKRIQQDCESLPSNVDLNQLVHFGGARLALKMQDLMAACRKLDYLLRSGRSSPALRTRIEALLETIKLSPALDEIDLFQGVRDFNRIYFDFCELAATGMETNIIISELRKLVKVELDNAHKRVEDFGRLRKRYDAGRRDIETFFENKVDAAQDKGFREGVCAAEESQQIYAELESIDEALVQIGDTLNRSKEFWENVDRKLKGTPSTPPSEQAKDPPGGIESGPTGIQRHAERIHSRLHTVCQAAQQYTGSRKVLKRGNDLVKCAIDFREDCTTVVKTHFSVKETVHSQGCGARQARTALSPLTKGLKSVLKCHEKLSVRFAKYAQNIYLLFWFAESTADQKRGSENPDEVALAISRSERLSPYLLPLENPDEVALAILWSKRLSSYLLPFESLFVRIELELGGIQRFWEAKGRAVEAGFS